MTKRPTAIQRLAATAGASLVAIGAMMGSAQADHRISRGEVREWNADYNDGYREGVFTTARFYDQVRNNRTPDGMNVVAAIINSDCDDNSEAFCSGLIAGYECISGEVAVALSMDKFIHPKLSAAETDKLTASQRTIIRGIFLEQVTPPQQVQYLDDAKEVCLAALPPRAIP